MGKVLKVAAPLIFGAAGGLVGGLLGASFSTGFAVANVGYGLLFGEDVAQGPLQAPTVEDSSYDYDIPEYYGTVGAVRGNVICCSKNEKGEYAGFAVHQGRTDVDHFLTAQYMLGRSGGGTLFSPGPLFVDVIEMEDTDGRRTIYNRAGATEDERGFEMVQEVSAITGRVISEISTDGVLRLYTGTDEQMPDSALAEFYPEGLSAHRGVASVVFNRLPSHSPPTFYFTVRSLLDGRVEIVTARLTQCGIPAARLALDALAAAEPATVAGKPISSRTAARQVCEQTGRAVHVDFAFDGARILATSRADPVIHEITGVEVGAWAAGGENSGNGDEESEGRLVLQHKGAEEFASQVDVPFWDSESNYDANTASSVPRGSGRINPKQVDIGEAGDLVTMVRLARALADEDAAQKSEMQLSLLPGREEILVGEVLRVPLGKSADEEDLGTQDFLLTEQEFSPDGIQALTGTDHNADAYSQTGEVTGNPRPPGAVESVGDLVYVLWDGNALFDTHLANPGFYAVVTKPIGKSWGAVGISSELRGSELWAYERVTRNMIRGTLGATLGALGDWASQSFEPDFSNSVTVDLVSGTLASAAIEELIEDAGLNLALIGREYLQYATATIVLNPDDDQGLWDGKRRYTLSGFLRGRRGTESHIGEHAAGDTFVLLDDAVYRLAVANQFIGLDVEVTLFEQAGPRQDNEDLTFHVDGTSLLPYSPLHLKAALDGADIAFSWTRRSRATGTYYNTGADVPLAEDSERYAVEILDGDDVLRVLNSATPAVTYTAAQQTADFGAPLVSGDEIAFAVYQLGALIGRGYGALATITLD